MPDETTPTPKPKRSRKPSTPRTRKPKDPGILAIEQAAAKQKEEYRKAQSSAGVLKRITGKLLPRLTEEHRQSLYDLLSAMLPVANESAAPGVEELRRYAEPVPDPKFQ